MHDTSTPLPEPGEISRPIHRFLSVMALLYALLMLWLLFGQRIGQELPGDYWSLVAQNYNIKPFDMIARYWYSYLHTSRDWLREHAFINLVGNVVMFIPLGFFLPYFFPKLRRVFCYLLAQIGLVVMIELVQLFTLLGRSDIDDLILNTAGAAIGYLVFRLFVRWTGVRAAGSE